MFIKVTSVTSTWLLYGLTKIIPLWNMNIYIAPYHWNHNNVLGLELKGEKGKKKKGNVLIYSICSSRQTLHSIQTETACHVTEQNTGLSYDLLTNLLIWGEICKFCLLGFTFIFPVSGFYSWGVFFGTLRKTDILFRLLSVQIAYDIFSVGFCFYYCWSAFLSCLC